MNDYGPSSPKKKLSCGLTSTDKLNAVPDFSVPAEIEFDSDDEEEIVEVEDFDETEFDSSSSSEEEYVEEVVEYEDSADESVSESETETTGGLQDEINLLTNEIKPNVRRGGSFKSNDDDFEALPPPIEIPNALRPPHLRTPNREKPVFQMPDSDSDSSSDDSDDSSTSSSFSPRKSPAGTLRPSAVAETKKADTPKKVEPPVSANRTEESSSEESEDESVPKDTNDGSESSSDESEESEVSESRNANACDVAEIKEAAPESPPQQKVAPVQQQQQRQHPVAPKSASNTSKRKPVTPSIDTSPRRSADNDDDEGEKKFAWEKPAWLNSSLKSTSKGAKLRSGEYLSMPITDLPHMKRDAGSNEPDRGSGVARTKSDVAHTRTAPVGVQRTKSDMQVVHRAAETSNTAISSPSSPRKPSKVFTKPAPLPENSKPAPPVIRDSNGNADFAWEKPSWTTKALRSTAKGEKVKSGRAIERPIGGVKPVG